MLTPQELLEIVDTMYPLLDELNTWIVDDLIKRLMARMARGEDLSFGATDTWQLELYQAAGGHYEELTQKIGEWTKKSDAEVKAIFEDAGLRAWNADDAFYMARGFASVSLLKSEALMRILLDTYQRTNGEIHNFTRTTAEHSEQHFMNVCDKAHLKVITGAQSYTGAVIEAVDELIDQQAKVKYPTGHVDTIETAVLRCVRTGTAQASGNLSIQGMVEHGWDIIRVSAHLGARYGDSGENPSNHFWWQGKLYSREGKTPGLPDFVTCTGYGTGAGLCGWNCRHSFGPGDPEHNPYEEYDAAENKKAFDLSQQQRAMERGIRKSKTTLRGYNTAIQNCEDNETRKALQEKYDRSAQRLSRQNKAYNEFCKANNLKRYDDRLRAAKWNRSEATKAAKAAARADKRDADRERNLQYIRDDVNIKANSGLPKTVQEPDTTIPHTVEVNFKNLQGVVPVGATATDVYTMAGAGTSTPIRDLRRLYETYPEYGEANGWKKKSGTAYAEYHHYVVHWYENTNGVPDAEIKLKGAK